jgi:hypothetical protein
LAVWNYPLTSSPPAFRDRAAGSDRNRTRNTEAGDAKGAARGGYAARGRGGMFRP